jgi:glycosyltransferase involved in cell wall biosynthesis
MKVLLLSDTYSEHTEKWALGLAEKGIKVGLFSFNKASYEWYDHPNITLYFEPEQKINAESTLTKLSYFKYVTVLKKIIKHFEPDILHAHYATSYGIVGALTGFHPFILSVWGSDVYDFPRRSKVHRRLFQYNLKKADLLLSTSQIMREEVLKYTQKPVHVTPFGVDTAVFKPEVVDGKDKGKIYIGTIKPIEDKYGISHIIQAAKIVIVERGLKNIQFLLIGPSNEGEKYQAQINEAGLASYVTLTGRVPFNEITRYHNLLDIFLNVSIDDSESFGVAAVEAMSCEKPVIISDVGGLMEVAGNGAFAKVVPRANANAIAETILDLLANPDEARRLGTSARNHVLRNYDWRQNLELMINHYNSLLKKTDKGE